MSIKIGDVNFTVSGFAHYSDTPAWNHEVDMRESRHYWPSSTVTIPFCCRSPGHPKDPKGKVRSTSYANLSTIQGSTEMRISINESGEQNLGLDSEPTLQPKSTSLLFWFWVGEGLLVFNHHLVVSLPAGSYWLRIPLRARWRGFFRWFGLKETEISWDMLREESQIVSWVFHFPRRSWALDVSEFKLRFPHPPRKTCETIDRRHRRRSPTEESTSQADPWRAPRTWYLAQHSKKVCVCSASTPSLASIYQDYCPKTGVIAMSKSTKDQRLYPSLTHTKLAAFVEAQLVAWRQRSVGRGGAVLTDLGPCLGPWREGVLEVPNVRKVCPTSIKVYQL